MRHLPILAAVAIAAAAGAAAAVATCSGGDTAPPGPTGGGPPAGTRVLRPRTDRAATAATPEAAAPVASPPAPPPTAGTIVFPRLRGRVVDAATGAPIAGAEVRWGHSGTEAYDFSDAAHGASGADGSFDIEMRRALDDPVPPAELEEVRAGADGYLVASVRRPAPPVELRLWRAKSAAPGRLAVRALRGGTPWRGLVGVEAMDELGDREILCAVADADGRFVLHQVARGVVRVRIDDRVPWTDVRVLSDGTVDVELRTPPPGPFAGVAEADLVAKRDALAKRLQDARARGDAEDAAEAEALWTEAWAELMHRPAEHRPLVLTDLPERAGPFLRVAALMHGPHHVWRVPVEDRTATIAVPRTAAWPITVFLPGPKGAEVRTEVLYLAAGGGTIRVGDREIAVTTRKDGAIVVHWGTLAASDGD